MLNIHRLRFLALLTIATLTASSARAHITLEKRQATIGEGCSLDSTAYSDNLRPIGPRLYRIGTYFALQRQRACDERQPSRDFLSIPE